MVSLFKKALIPIGEKIMKVLAFAASNSRQSINKQLVSYAGNILKGGLIENVELEIIDLNDFEMPIFSVDREQESGIPSQAHDFYKKIGEADALLISYAEHNGTYTAAYKNLYDWTSRIDMKVFQGKAMVLLATSPGPGGASNVLASAKTSAPYFGGEVKADLSIPSYFDHVDGNTGKITNDDTRNALQAALLTLG